MDPTKKRVRCSHSNGSCDKADPPKPVHGTYLPHKGVIGGDFRRMVRLATKRILERRLAEMMPKIEEEVDAALSEEAPKEWVPEVTPQRAAAMTYGGGAPYPPAPVPVAGDND